MFWKLSQIKGTAKETDIFKPKEMNQEAYDGTLQIRKGLEHEKKKYTMALSQTTSIKGMSQERDFNCFMKTELYKNRRAGSTWTKTG